MPSQVLRPRNQAVRLMVGFVNLLMRQLKRIEGIDAATGRHQAQCDHRVDLLRHSGVSSQRRFVTAAPSLQNRPFVCSLKSQTKPKLHKGLRPRALVAVFGYEVNAPLLGALQVTEYVDTGTQK
jgi:hypothetical protein